MGAANVSCVRSRGRSGQIVGECNSWQLVIDFSDQIHHLAPWFSSPALSSVIVIYPKPLTHYFTPHTSVLRTHQRSTIPLEERTMGWQKTFTLSRRAKGCHLVTDEVVRNIQDGLNDVKVLFFAFYPPSRHVSISKCLNLLGRDVIPFHVRCSSNFVRLSD